MTRTERLFLEAVFLLVLITFSIAFIRLLLPFWLDIFIALVFANIFRRPFQWVVRKTGNNQLGAGVVILLVLVIVAVPVTIVAMIVSSEIAAAVAEIQQNWAGIQANLNQLPLFQNAESVPILGSLLGRVPTDDLSTLLREVITSGGDTLLKISQRSFANVGAAVFNFLIVLLLLFFVLADGSRLIRRVYETIPLSNREIDQIVAETFNTTSATLISTVIIGLMEGGLATLLFAVFGLPSPFLWGIIVMVLSMIPLIGTNLVVVPAGLITLFSGRPVAGVVIVAAGVVGVFITQNAIKPKLLGDRSGLNPALALLATIGGIAWLGIIGFLIGPVLASLFIVVWRQFALRYRTLLAGKDTYSSEWAAEADQQAEHTGGDHG